MNRYFRQSWIGLAAGLASSPALIATQDNTVVAIALAAIIGMVFELVFRHIRYAYLDSLMAGAAFGIPLWASISIILFPIIGGRMPQWTAAGMRALFPELAGWVLYGAFVGLVLQALRDLIPQPARYETEAPQRIVPNKRIVILGGGFGGMSIGDGGSHRPLAHRRTGKEVPRYRGSVTTLVIPCDESSSVFASPSFWIQGCSPTRNG